MRKALLLITGVKYEPNIVFMWKSYRTSEHGTKNVNTYDKTECWTPLHANNTISHEPSYKQQGVKKNQT